LVLAAHAPAKAARPAASACVNRPSRRDHGLLIRHHNVPCHVKREKGGLSVYGLGRFPVTLYTLYKEQWRKLLGKAEEIETFLRENDTQLKSKDA
jgi:hypothetical protein